MRGHRRSRRGAAPSRRRRAVPRRREPASHSLRWLLLSFGLIVLALGVLLGPQLVGSGWRLGGAAGDGRITLAAVPADAPELGLVYEGLAPALADSPCAGAYQLDTPETCTHGPDLPPPGLSVNRDVAPVTAPTNRPVTPRREDAPAPSDAKVLADVGGLAPDDDGPALIPDPAPGDAAFTRGPEGVACAGDGASGKRVQMLYLYEFGTASRFGEYLGSFRRWAAEVDGIFDASAAQTGGSRHVRFVTTPECAVDVTEVQLPDAALESFDRTITALRDLGYNRTDRKYLLAADVNRYCGIATFINDRRPGAGNRNNGGPSYARVDAGCWGPTMLTHQLAHALGAVLPGAPNASAAGRCTDDHDIMCQQQSTATALRKVCGADGGELRLDCNHDDYFAINPRPGSFLAENWNVADSEFLLAGDGGPAADSEPATGGGPGRDDAPGDGPDAEEDPADPDAPEPDGGPSAAPAEPDEPEPGPSPPDPDAPSDGGEGTPPGDSAPTAPGPTAPGGPASGEPGTPGDPSQPGEPGQPGEPLAPAEPDAGPADPDGGTPGREERSAVLEIRDATSTSVGVAWPVGAAGTRYVLAVDGEPVATTTATRGRLVGLRPDTKYRLQVLTAEDPDRPYTAVTEARTPPAARPADNAWFVLTNSLTGRAADLYAARSADNAPIVLNRADGGAQQQFELVSVGGKNYQLQSRASGKCVAPLGGNPAAGVPLVQAKCDEQDTGQRWRIRRTDHGFSLGSTVGGLVAGAGTQRFGGPRVLVLQEPDQSRHQSWTALPG